MAIFAIGDIQGCYDELARLIDRIRFDPARDELWFVGDLINRGPRSIDVLRFVRGLEASSTVVLGNHDLHLLAARFNPERLDDSLREILAADDAEELLEWLRRQPLVHYQPDLNSLLVHAGLDPHWDPLTAVKLAREVEDCLRSDDHEELLRNMYGDQPDRWSAELSGIDRLRYIVNCLTRIRYCRADGSLEFTQKGPPADLTESLTPWFDMPDRASCDVRIVAGHWSSLGLVERPDLLMIDTGCVWGRELTAARIDGPLKVFSVKATADSER